jgi:hypothetical protein
MDASSRQLIGGFFVGSARQLIGGFFVAIAPYEKSRQKPQDKTR